MNSIAQMLPQRRAEVFTETGDRRNLPGAVVEKDFWVCWVLKQLFSTAALSERLLFKGGTSLSKVFHAIERFSEDIDLAVDYASLGFTGDRDPRRDGISKTKRAAILADMMTECQGYIAGGFLDVARTRFGAAMGNSNDWSLKLDAQDPNIAIFSYPIAVKDQLAYVRPQVILELGTHAEFIPQGRFTIRSFAAEEFPNLMPEPEAHVRAILAKRTFWEKIAILHAEYHRPEEKALPKRYSRHYYDVAMLAGGPVKNEALADMDLLARVVSHKQVFYPSAWARYGLAAPGSIRLAPRDSRVAALKQDYRAMENMIFGEPPKFDKILSVLRQLESELNHPAKEWAAE